MAGLSESTINNITKQELLEGYEREVEEESVMEAVIGIGKRSISGNDYGKKGLA